MYIIVGLGNPGSRYEGTRHNMGFDVIDRLIENNRIPQAGRKFHAVYGTGMIGGEKVVLAKPITFMNLSGTSVRELTDFYKIDPSRELIVISESVPARNRRTGSWPTGYSPVFRRMSGLKSTMLSCVPRRRLRQS